MNTVFIGIIILLAAYMVNRFLMTEATKKLGDEEKLKVFETFSKRNNYASGFFFAIVVAYLAAMQFLPEMMMPLTIIYMIIFFIYLAYRSVSNYKKLKQIQMPAFYINRFIVSYSIFYLSVFALFGGGVWNWLN